MARRKRMLDDGDDSDSSNNSNDVDMDLENDPDAREERNLFENPYQNKRRKRNGKEDAIYGVFGDDSDEDSGYQKSSSKAKRSDWTKAPAFVTGDKPVKLDEPMATDPDDNDSDSEGEAEEEEDSEDDGSDAQEDAVNSDESEHSRPPSPRVRMDDEDEEESRPKPAVGGIGSLHPRYMNMSAFSSGAGLGATSSDTASEMPQMSRGGIGSGRGGIGAGKGGIGSSKGGIGSKATELPEESPTPPLDSGSATNTPTPSAFASRSQSFMRTSTPTAPVALPAHEMAHFNKIQGTFGARMLAKMGWQAGTGLGAGGEGIVTPIESKLRPQKMGIAFKGFKEKTEQSKLEAKRRGEVVSDDEDEKVKKQKKKAQKAQEKRADAWKRPKKVKTKTEHKTYEQILAEAGDAAPAPGIGQIIDATGAVPREVSSLADVSLNSWAPSNDPTRIPEVRHNIRLIAEACKSELDGLAREAKALNERKKFVIQEDLRLRKKVEDEAEMISRLQQIQIVANDINTVSRDLSSVYEVSLEPFSPLFQKLLYEYAAEYDKYRLDEVVVAAIAPVMRRMAASWAPLEDPTRFLDTFRSWRQALKINDEEPKPETQVDVYGTKTTVARPMEELKPMTPFESLLWNVWLPRVRTSINNDWNPENPQPAVKLYEAWSSFLPPFIRDNLLDQLILPKVQKAVADWNPRRAKVSLQAIVFPWLPHVGLRLEEVVGDARRKIKSLLRSWVVEEPIPADLVAWRDVFDIKDWDAMLLKYVVPKLGATLRNDFRINPRDQKMEPLQRVFAWSDIVRASILSQLIETEFFPKWLDVLHIWLIQPRASFDEVSQWYTFWRDVFPEKIRNLPDISRGFTRGLQLMNKAIEYGPDAPTKLAKPDFLAERAAANAPPARGPAESAKVARPSARTHEITFRAIVEEYAASHNLLFIPLGKAHERSRMPLFRVSRTADGKKGLTVYILDDAVWAPKVEGGVNVEREDFKAISLEDMVLRAS